MDSQIAAFVQSLADHTTQADEVARILSDDPNLAVYLQKKSWDAVLLIGTACVVLELVLGKTKVVTGSMETPLVDDNW